VDLSELANAKKRDFLIRFAFGALVSAGAALVSLRFGPRAGGLLLAFPAILPATLTLVERDEGVLEAAADASGGILGAAGLAAFAAVAYLLLRPVGIAALVITMAAWSAVSFVFYFAVRRLVARSGAPGSG
jgi:hypothetical protein